MPCFRLGSYWLLWNLVTLISLPLNDRQAIPQIADNYSKGKTRQSWPILPYKTCLLPPKGPLSSGFQLMAEVLLDLRASFAQRGRHQLGHCNKQLRVTCTSLGQISFITLSDNNIIQLISNDHQHRYFFFLFFLIIKTFSITTDIYSTIVCRIIITDSHLCKTDAIYFLILFTK